MTVRHLLTHTGGTGDIFGPEFDANRLTLRDHSDYVALFGSRALAFEPGAAFEYSNYGFVLLGALIEAVSGSRTTTTFASNVFAPGRHDRHGLAAGIGGRPGPCGRVHAGRRGRSWVPNTDTLPWRGTSAGGGYSTVGDLLRFAEALSTGKLISKATLAEATSPQSAGAVRVRLRDPGEGSLRSYGHGGGAPGMNGELRIFPELGYVVVGLSNLDPPAAVASSTSSSCGCPTPRASWDPPLGVARIVSR